MNRILKIVVGIIFLVLAAPFLLIAVLFAWNMIGQTHEAEFRSPSGSRILTVMDDCRFVGCATFAWLRYEIDGRKAKMSCKPLAQTDDRFVFAGNPRVQWDEAETKVLWQEAPSDEAGRKPLSGTLDLVSDCYHQVQFVQKGLPLSFKFRENCLGPTCRREMILWYSGDDYLFVPCEVTVAGRDLVFSTGDDSIHDVEVVYDEALNRATWKHRSTGHTGVVDLEKDCDRSRQWRERPPA